MAAILAILAFAVPFWLTQQVTVRAFYARGDTWRPMLLATALVVAAVPFYALASRHGTLSLAGASVLAITTSAAGTVLLARRMYGSPTLLPLATAFLRAAAIAGVAGLASWATLWLVEWAAGSAVTEARAWVRALVDLGAGGGAFALVVVAGVSWFGDDASREALARVRRKLRLPGGR